MTVAQLRELLADVPDYYEVRLTHTRPVAGLEHVATENGPFVVVV